MSSLILSKAELNYSQAYDCYFFLKPNRKSFVLRFTVLPREFQSQIWEQLVEDMKLELRMCPEKRVPWHSHLLLWHGRFDVEAFDIDWKGHIFSQKKLPNNVQSGHRNLPSLPPTVDQPVCCILFPFLPPVPLLPALPCPCWILWRIRDVVRHKIKGKREMGWGLTNIWQASHVWPTLEVYQPSLTSQEKPSVIQSKASSPFWDFTCIFDVCTSNSTSLFSP